MTEEICIIVGLDPRNTILAVSDIAWEMLALKKLKQVIFIRDCKGFQDQSINLLNGNSQPYFPEMDHLYGFFRERLGAEGLLEALQSEDLIISSLETFDQKIQMDSILILEGIEAMDLGRIKSFVERKAPGNIIYMTYCGDNMAFADLMIEEINKSSRDTHGDSVRVWYLQENQYKERPLNQSQGMATFMALSPVVQPNFDFWGMRNALPVLEFLGGTSESGPQDDQVHRVHMMEVEEVQSSFWGPYKVIVFKQVTKGNITKVQEELQSGAQRPELKKLRVSGLTSESKNKYLVGKLSGCDLLGEDHIVIVKKGERITTEIIDKSEDAGKLVELILHMTLPGLDG